MKRILFALALFSAFFFMSCFGKNSKNVLRVNVASEPDSFFPWESAAADTAAIYYNIFDGLLSFDEKGALHPALAESYEISDDKLTYTFHLRQGVKFHNGADFSSADCLYTYENLAGLNGNSVRSDMMMRSIESLSAPDEKTFTITLKYQNGGFLALNICPILPVGYTNHAEQPIGTGAYKFVEYQLHQKVVLEKNENYWNKENEPKIPRIEIYVMSDENAILSALQSKQLDIGQMLSAENARTLEKKFQLFSAPQNMVQVLGLNNSVKPLDNPLVRQAITMAVNKDEIIDGAMGGFGTKLYSNFSPILGAYYNDRLSEVYKNDINQAKSLLASAGYGNGFDLEITVPGNYRIHVDTAQIIAKQLEQIGIRCKIKTVEWTTWLDQVYTKFDYQATVIAFAGKLEPSEVLRRYYSSYKRNFTRYNNPVFDETFDKAELETDNAKRVKYYKYCQELLTKSAPAVFIADPNNTVLLRKDVRGYETYPVLFYNFAKMYFE
ncbi:ABC transporter substrate-binding protein [Treponema sp. UBA3813]|uniref:ABC transporter substrate-binding protein n=1 Tax=Treponema sp. UBA3813 TaxID=1947715 RepID=UPI0025D823A4|nr:ABC transporter substrate-binding protein [Treponema sp. UBA3813]